MVPKSVEATTKLMLDAIDVNVGAASHSVVPGGDTQIALPTIDPRLSHVEWIVGFHDMSFKESVRQTPKIGSFYILG